MLGFNRDNLFNLIDLSGFNYILNKGISWHPIVENKGQREISKDLEFTPGQHNKFWYLIVQYKMQNNSNLWGSAL